MIDSKKLNEKYKDLLTQYFTILHKIRSFYIRNTYPIEIENNLMVMNTIIALGHREIRGNKI